MAIRPVVLVYQDFATPTITSTTPDLNCLVVGPAYWIQDYFQPGTTNPADKANIGLTSVYGQLEAPPDTVTPVGPGVIITPDAPNNLPGAVLDSTSVVVYFDQARVEMYHGTAGTTSASTPNLLVVSDTVDFTAAPNLILPGDRVIIVDGSYVQNVIVRTVFAVVNATTLQFTQDIPTVGFTPGSGQHYRIERQLNDQVVSPSYYTTSGNAISINGSIVLTIPTQGTKIVTYAKPYIQYRSLRTDLQQVSIAASDADITTRIGRIDTRNPLAVGVFVALQNTTHQVQYYGVKSNDLLGYTDCRDKIASDPTVYAIVPLTADDPTLAMWQIDCEGRANVANAEATGIPQRFRVTIGSGTLPLTAQLITPQTHAKTAVSIGSAPSTITAFTIPGISLISSGVRPGDHLHITLDTGGTVRNGSYLIAAIIDATHLEVDPSTPIPAAETGNASVEIRAANDTTVKIAVTAITGLVSIITGDLYLLLQDPDGSFVSSGIMAGDILEMPGDPTTNNYGTTPSKFVIATILSENRLLIANNGQDTATVQNELPHGQSWASGTTVPITNTLNYQIVRNLSKDQQVTALIAQAQAHNSSRLVLVWPDLVDLAGVVGGSSQNGGQSQPGYYLSCAVGGMTAGLPPHQGFTFLGIAGTQQIYHSNTYFTDTQLTHLSNGGWFVFAQQTPTSLPSCIHQLTTNVSTLESGEFSVVKNFDFVSLFFVAILEVFLGSYNVTPEVLTFLRTALNTGGTTLTRRVYAKIGAPLTSFSITSLAVSPTSADRVVTYVAIGLPKPLNVIELHLVA